MLDARLQALGLAWLPILMTACMAIGFGAMFIAAAVRKDVYPWLPYISDAGALPPESCIFSLFLSLGAICAMLLMYARHKQIVEFHKEDVARVLRFNRWSLVLGALSVLGMLIVAAFQDVNQLTMHAIGAALVFICGVLYAVLQTIISFRTLAPPRTSYTRLLITIVAFAALVCAGGFGMVASEKEPTFDEIHNCTAVPWKANRVSDKDKPWPGYWKPCLGGYPYHVASAACEWVLAISFTLFFLTYTREFRRIVLHTYVRMNAFGGYAPINDHPGGSMEIL